MAVDEALVAREVAGWVERTCGAERGPQDPLFSAGVLDSVRLQELVAWVEDRYGVTVEPWDLSLANFDSAAAVAAFVAAADA